MVLKSSKNIKKSLYFEGSGESISIEICLENIIPDATKAGICSFLDDLYENIKMEIN